jgi:antitoxin VapB
MSIVIDDPEIERLARDYAARTGERVEDAIGRLLRAQQPAGDTAEETEAEREERLARAQEIVRRIQSKLSDDGRSADEILGYDEHGLPR